MGFNGIYPLVIYQNSYWTWPSGNRGFSQLHSMGIFHSYVPNCQRVMVVRGYDDSWWQSPLQHLLNLRGPGPDAPCRPLWSVLWVRVASGSPVRGVSTVAVVDGYRTNINTKLYTSKMEVYMYMFFHICLNGHILRVRTISVAISWDIIPEPYTQFSSLNMVRAKHQQHSTATS